MKKRVRRMRRAGAAAMAAVTFSVSVAAPAAAAPPKVQADETMYVNLDYYGAETEINVVKGLTPNGLETYTDYGVYDKVVNMTDQTEPIQAEDSVTWQLPRENSRFYYQATLPEGQMELPWTFDVSYKLNGAETAAEQLAGASGLIEIRVKAIPNKEAKAYYRNNLMLAVAVPADLSKCYSIEAPGSQLQTMGDYSAAVFMALPGEEGDFTVRIGTDDYESTGVLMMMIPGTASAFDHIADLKEAKDTWREDGEALYESFDSLLASFEQMKSGVGQVQDGLGQLESARQVISGSRAAMEANSTQAIQDLASVTDQTAVLIPYLETAQHAVTDLNDNARAIYNTMADTQDELDDLYDSLKSLRNSLESASESIGSGITPAEQQAIGTEIGEKVGELEELLEALGQMNGTAGAEYSEAEEELQNLNQALAQADGFRYDRGEEEDAGSDTVEAFSTEELDAEIQPLQEADRRGPSGQPGSGGENDADFEEWQEEMEAYEDEVESYLQTLSGSSYSGDMEGLLQMAGGILGSSGDIEAGAGALIGRLNSLCASIGNAGEDTADVVSDLRRCTDQLVSLLDDTRVLIDTMDSYVPSMLDALGDTQELMNRLTRAMGSTENFLNVVNNTLIASGGYLDQGTESSIAGMQELLGNSLSALESLGAVREASRNMKNTLDEQLDQYEEENNFLNMDPSAPLVSFTSGKNPSPHSIQIILRTQEIEKDDADTALDIEASAQAGESPLQRMWNVIVKIVRAVVEIFKNR